MDLVKRIKKQNIAIMGNKAWMALGGVMCFGKWEVSETMPTACTDGKNVWYGREFCEPLSDEELRFLILHETMHKAAMHMFIYKQLHTLDGQRANAACDYWINNELIKQDDKTGFIKMIDGGLYNPKYDKMTVVEIFKDLEQYKQQPQDSEGDDAGEGEGENSQNQCRVVDRDGQGNRITEGYPQGGGMDEHDWDSLSDDDKATIEKDIEIAIRQGRQLAGKMGGDKPRMIDGLLEGKVDWASELAEFIKERMAGRDESSWSKLNRRMFDVGYFPGSISNTTGRLAIAPDTSGSIWGEQLARFMGEIKKLCAELKPAGIDILWWDMEVCSVQSFEQDQLDNIESYLKPVGGGGTRPQCVADWLSLNKNLNHECVVLLSDGYVDSFPVFSIPAMWVMTTDIVAEHGKTVRMEDI